MMDEGQIMDPRTCLKYWGLGLIDEGRAKTLCVLKSHQSGTMVVKGGAKLSGWGCSGLGMSILLEAMGVAMLVKLHLGVGLYSGGGVTHGSRTPPCIKLNGEEGFRQQGHSLEEGV